MSKKSEILSPVFGISFYQQTENSCYSYKLALTISVSIIRRELCIKVLKLREGYLSTLNEEQLNNLDDNFFKS